MKTAGTILSNLLDEGFIKKAQGISKFFDSWSEITANNKIAAAESNSRIKDLDKGILLIEVDHPGWKQIIQTKQSSILNEFRLRFPELNISGMSLILKREGLSIEEQAEESAEKMEKILFPEPKAEKQIKSIELPAAGLDAINDDDFKAKLLKLGQTIANREDN